MLIINVSTNAFFFYFYRGETDSALDDGEGNCLDGLLSTFVVATRLINGNGSLLNPFEYI